MSTGAADDNRRRRRRIVQHLRRPSSIATIGLVLVTASWGSTFVTIKAAVERMPVADFLAVRFAIAALVLFAMRPRTVMALRSDQRQRGLLLGAAYGSAQLLQTWGLHSTSAAVSGFITGMYVVFTPLMAALIFRRRVGVAAWSGVVVATTGLAVMTLRGFSVGTGELLVLASALVYALHILGLGAWSKPADAYGLTVIQLFAVTFVCTVPAVEGGIELPPDWEAWASLLFAALIAGAAALVIQTWAQAHLAPTRAAVVMTMEPVFAAGFAVWLGGEPLTARMLIGGAMVLCAMYVVELGPRQGAVGEVTHVGPV